MNDEQRWAAVRNRDARCDGKFLYGVVTTGVFCHPSCPSRRPLRKNVRFYATPDAAARDGLRPCLRCRPLAAAGDDAQAARIHAVARHIEAHAHESLPLSALAAHLEGTRPRLDLPLDMRGTAFQMKVWSFLQRIPYGEVRSYAEVAGGVGAPRAVRAVASACAANRIAVAIPCHRVIRGDGGLGGYRWGLERKRALIDAERGAV